MDDIEQHLNTIVERYREQIRPFTDRISQIEASNKKLREENKKLREAIERHKVAILALDYICDGTIAEIQDEELYKALEE